MQHACKNHPENPAYHRCYTCGEYICRSCSTLKFHHYFCCSHCMAEYVVKTYTRIFIAGCCRQFRKYLRPLHISAEKTTVLIIALQAAIFILLIADLALNRRFMNDIEQMGRSVTELSALAETAVRPGLPAPADMRPVLTEIRSTIPRTTLFDTLSIRGKGTAGGTYLLYVNGVLNSAEHTRSGRFTFGGIRLFSGENTLAVRTMLGDSIFGNTAFPVFYRPSATAELAKNVNRGRRDSRRIALTFDGGSNAAHASQILDILAEYDMQATFFLTGRFIDLYPDISRRIAQSGHAVGNHTDTHPHLTMFEETLTHETRPGITRSVLHRELYRTDSLFAAVTGRAMDTLWRSPFGEQNSEIRLWAAEAGYRHIGWTSGDRRGESMDTRDWVSDEESELYMTAEEIKEALLRFGDESESGANGAIVLMHLGSTRDGEFFFEKLPDVIETFRARGYLFCTIPELLDIHERK